MFAMCSNKSKEDKIKFTPAEKNCKIGEGWERNRNTLISRAFTEKYRLLYGIWTISSE